MSIKTIAVETSVYEKLAHRRKPGESFTKAINRLLDSTSGGTCADAVREAAALWGANPTTEAEAAIMDGVVLENRLGGDWEVEQP